MIWNNPKELRRLATNTQCIRTIDMHTGGEPVRIVLDGFPKLSGSILNIRRELHEKYDYFRKAIIWEPRGHADMYGVIPVPPQRKNSHFGVIFIHNEGYSTMCGHATLAVAKCAIELGWVQSKKGITEIRIDAPCGQIIAYSKAESHGGRQYSFDNVASFVSGLNYHTHIRGIGNISYDIAFGGAFYSYVDVDQLGLKIKPANARKFISLGKQIKANVQAENQHIRHPYHDDLSFLYGTIFTDDSEESEIHSQNVCIFADGELDRSPTGSGISGRAALLHAKGELNEGNKLTIQSIINSEMSVEIIKTTKFGPYDAVIPRVSGKSFFTGTHQFWIDPTDPYKSGFLLGN